MWPTPDTLAETNTQTTTPHPGCAWGVYRNEYHGGGLISAHPSHSLALMAAAEVSRRHRKAGCPCDNQPVVKPVPPRK